MPEQGQVKEPFASWGRLEIMGHLRFDGWIEEVDLFGVTMVAVEPLNEEGNAQPRRYFGASSIYSLSPTSEEEIRAEIAKRREWAQRRQRMMQAPLLEEVYAAGYSTQDVDDDEDGDG